ncbi:transglutaminase-like domain-containing protein [Actinospongicola halichondriae]|uniref:transglutaminase-like domain-containing protein n=1 Tax=Actinospongicola halichondriae TaxID=3236844 RepID=UPI003D465098
MSNSSGHRSVSCSIGFSVTSPAVFAFQVAAAQTAGPRVDELLDVTVDGATDGVDVDEIETHRDGRTHVVRAEPGMLSVQYEASVGPADVAIDVGGGDAGYDDEVIAALRQSRYCQSDALGRFASTEFAPQLGSPDLARTIAAWVHDRFAYVPGVSGPLDTALDTLVRHEGVCRDFAHVTIALCRAVGIPARLVAVYAPGLSPMDFHAVAEVRIDGTWEILDSTRLAPRQSLVRIATGRDAADTAFATTLSGDAELVSLSVSAVTEGPLPNDDHRGSVTIA